jgi:hypothetical protein
MGICVSCGIESYLYLAPIDEGNISHQLNTSATVIFPPRDSFMAQFGNYFTHFTIYYRIYVSDINQTGSIETDEIRSSINSALYSDFSYFKSYTTSDTTTTSIGPLFRNRNYYPLWLYNNDIEGILDSDALGRTMTVDFTPTQALYPVLSFGNTEVYSLYRSNGNDYGYTLFNPLPDRYFINSTELNRSENITSSLNADVVNKSGISGERYTYVSMYIVAAGVDTNFTPIYSRPTHIGIFRLPNRT